MNAISSTAMPDMPTGALGNALAKNGEISPERAELRQVAKQFEALLVQRMLSTARAADFGGEDLIGGPGLKQFETMRDEHVAQLAADTGAFGFARAIEDQLAARIGMEG